MSGRRAAVGARTARRRQERLERLERRGARRRNILRGLSATAATAALAGVLVSTVYAPQPQTATATAAAVPAHAQRLELQPVDADAGKLTFNRPSVTSRFDEDTKLEVVLKTANGKITPVAPEEDVPAEVVDAALEGLDIAGILDAPAEDASISSVFGHRTAPLKDFHTGQDYAQECGAPVQAAADGEIVIDGFHKVRGNWMAIDHGNGLQTSYGHLSESVAEIGDTVKRGETIARTGTTGLSFGCHIHFEVTVDGVLQDPADWVKGGAGE